MQNLTRSTLLGLASLVSIIFFSIAAHAATDEVYECDAIGDGNYVVYISGNDLHTAWARYVMNGKPSDATKMKLREGEQYIGKGLIFSLHGSTSQISDLGADVTVSCSRVSEHNAGSNNSNARSLNVAGKALGGNMRKGPGTNFAKVGSAKEGTSLTILNNSGVRFDGYDWFEVRLNGGRRGYIWGGILCSEGSRLDGLLYACDEWSALNQRHVQQSGGGWMAFAIGPDGRWGHGAANSQFQARQFALNNCGANCRVDAETQSRCQALVTAPGQFWYGDAGSAAGAESNALNFCSARSSNCRVEYSYCR